MKSRIKDIVADASSGVASAPVAFVSIGLVLAFWETVVRLLEVPAYLVPTPSALVVRMVEDWDVIQPHVGVTAWEVLVGFGAAIVVSVPLAAVLAHVRFLERAAYPILIATQTVPKVAIAPLLVIWFGFGMGPKIAITFLMCFFPILIDALAGFKAISKEVAWLGKSMGASRFDMFVSIRLPNALAHIFSGLKVASTLAIVGAVVGEFVGADRGLGYLLIAANGQLDIELAFCVLILLTIMGMFLFALVELAERILMPWHISQRSGAIGVVK